MKILIVEDNNGVRRFLCDVVRREGHKVEAAVNGREGVSQCKEFEPDIIISDIEMPKLNGLDMLEKIRLFDTESIVVMITGHGSEEYAIKAIQRGAHNYLKKPVSLSSLTELLHKYQSVVENRTAFAHIPGKTVRREFTMEFENCLESVDKIIDNLVWQAADRLGRKDRLAIHLGLLELMVNSMEHGNLEITYEEKAHALASGTLQQLRDQRRNDPRLASRYVTVDFKSDASGCEWIISDQGKGFDWRSVPNPLSPHNLVSHNGRGIAISRRHFDEFEYRNNGAVVRVKKYADKNRKGKS